MTPVPDGTLWSIDADDGRLTGTNPDCYISAGGHTGVDCINDCRVNATEKGGIGGASGIEGRDEGLKGLVGILKECLDAAGLGATVLN